MGVLSPKYISKREHPHRDRCASVEMTKGRVVLRWESRC
jgi:hypothetical protein